MPYRVLLFHEYSVHSLLPVFKLTTVDLQCRTQVGLWQALSVTAGFLLINIFCYWFPAIYQAGHPTAFQSSYCVV